MNTKILFHRGVYLSEKNLGQNFFSTLKSNYHNFLEINTQASSCGGGKKI